MTRFACLLVAVALLFASAPSRAAETPEQTIAAVESYLGGLGTLRAHFVQTGNDGKQASGTFLLKRPGRMRIDYDPPVKDFIVSDGLLIYYYDSEMKQQSSTPISRSLADFFLRKDLKLSGDIAVSDVKQEEKNVSLVLTQAKNPLAGSLTLTLSQNPLQLQKWTVVDAQGIVTTVELTSLEQGIDLPSSLFHYYDPGHSTHLYNDK